MWAPDSIIHLQNELVQRQAEITWLEIKIYTVGHKYGHFKSFLTFEEAQNYIKICNTSCTYPKVSTAIKNCASGAVYTIGGPIDWGQTVEEFNLAYELEQQLLRKQQSTIHTTK